MTPTTPASASVHEAATALLTEYDRLRGAQAPAPLFEALRAALSQPAASQEAPTHWATGSWHSPITAEEKVRNPEANAHFIIPLYPHPHPHPHPQQPSATGGDGEPKPYTRAEWVAEAVKVYLAAGDDEKTARECATYLWSQQDFLTGELEDPTDAALADVQGRPAPIHPAQERFSWGKGGMKPNNAFGEWMRVPAPASQPTSGAAGDALILAAGKAIEALALCKFDSLNMTLADLAKVNEAVVALHNALATPPAQQAGKKGGEVEALKHLSYEQFCDAAKGYLMSWQYPEDMVRLSAELNEQFCKLNGITAKQQARQPMTDGGDV